MPGHPRKINRIQLAEDIHTLTHQALEECDYRAVAALVRALEILDEPAPAPAPAPRDQVVWLQRPRPTRQEHPRHGHLNAAGASDRCAVCGTAGVRACLACWDPAPGTVRAEGGQCGMCGTHYLGRAEAGSGPTGDGDRDLAALAAAVRDAGIGSTVTAPGDNDCARQGTCTGDPRCPTPCGEERTAAPAPRSPGAPGLGEARTETMPAVRPDDADPRDVAPRY